MSNQQQPVRKYNGKEMTLRVASMTIKTQAYMELKLKPKKKKNRIEILLREILFEYRKNKSCYWIVYQFPRAGVTNYYKLSGQEIHFHISGGQNSETKVSVYFLWRLREESVQCLSLSFWRCWNPCLSLAHRISLQSLPLLSHSVLLVFLSLWLCSFIIRTFDILDWGPS